MPSPSSKLRTRSSVHLHLSGEGDDDVDRQLRITRMSRAVLRGKLLRLAPGAYVRPSDWLEAPLWDRYAMALCATAATVGRTLFCRESALALWGVPTLQVATEVSLREPVRSHVGIRRPAPMTGSASQAHVSALLARHNGDAGGTGRVFSRRDLRAFPVRRLGVPVPQGLDRPGVQRMLRSGEFATPQIRLENLPFPWCEGAEFAFDVEPLGLAVLDTVAEASLREGAVILDAALAGRTQRGHRLTRADVGAWEHYLRTRPRSQRWARAAAFADPASESPGESAARAVIHELGFEVPELQGVFTLPDGSGARVDFVWRGAGVVGEFDGMVKYRRARELSGMSAEAALEAEKRREDALRSMGVRVVRLVWEDILHPERMRAKLLAAGVPRRAR